MMWKKNWQWIGGFHHFNYCHISQSLELWCANNWIDFVITITQNDIPLCNDIAYFYNNHSFVEVCANIISLRSLRFLSVKSFDVGNNRCKHHNTPSLRWIKRRELYNERFDGRQHIVFSVQCSSNIYFVLLYNVVHHPLRLL